MPKLDVGVGDEFPAREVHGRDREPETVEVHNHYYRRRGPFGLLRVFLWIALISLFFRALNWLTNPGDDWGRYHHDRWDGRWDGDWAAGPVGMAWPFFQLGGVIVAMAIIGVVLWLVRRRDGRC
jgi:hypothetical protein